MSNEKYKGGQKLVFGCLVGAFAALLFLTVGFDSGYFTLLELVKYCAISGGIVGLLNFIIYELGLNDNQKEKKSSASNTQSSSSYDNYTDISGGSDGGGFSGE
ncbi:hypothetical protein [Alteromonas mediterranea]|uniref:hypothetical protein n=1 Tax=Alteromonas mediterranea TaxID=314275 RepID=UPI0012FAF5A4|nr:hypothetical protein [Alteromonas mediterranea]QGX60617.1 hypothetical protein FJN15_02130 [Alteromonas mediterranea]